MAECDWCVLIRGRKKGNHGWTRMNTDGGGTGLGEAPAARGESCGLSRTQFAQIRAIRVFG